MREVGEVGDIFKVGKVPHIVIESDAWGYATIPLREYILKITTVKTDEGEFTLEELMKQSWDKFMIGKTIEGE